MIQKAAKIDAKALAELKKDLEEDLANVKCSRLIRC
jgi:hypothetical protein